jgi:predicted NUDIX family NTP pyrophosphohydrolase
MTTPRRRGSSFNVEKDHGPGGRWELNFFNIHNSTFSLSFASAFFSMRRINCVDRPNWRPTSRGEAG